MQLVYRIAVVRARRSRRHGQHRGYRALCEPRDRGQE